MPIFVTVHTAVRSAHLEIPGFPVWVVPSNTGIFLSGLKLCGESRTQQVLLVSKKKIGGNHAVFRDNKASIWKKSRTLLCILLFFRIIVAYLSLKKYMVNPNFLFGFQ